MRHGPNLLLPGLPSGLGLVRAAAAAPPEGPWLPSDLAALLAAWFDPADLTDGAVASWAARAGGVTLAQATSGFRPVKSATGFASAYPGVTFDATASQRLETTSLGSIPVGTVEGMIFAVIHCADNAVSTNPLAIRGSSGDRRFIKFNSEVAGVHDNSVSTNSAAGACLGSHVWTGEWLATQQNGWIDGNPFNGNPGTITLNTGTATRLRFGSSGVTTANAFHTGVIADVIFTLALSTANRQRVEGYLAWKYGLEGNLPSGHPYEDAAP